MNQEKLDPKTFPAWRILGDPHAIFLPVLLFLRSSSRIHHFKSKSVDSFPSNPPFSAAWWRKIQSFPSQNTIFNVFIAQIIFFKMTRGGSIPPSNQSEIPVVSERRLMRTREE
jgi:hypothetical protein